ncbi:eCIS core domain-containing protein [Aliikangiella coralliicola]|uniref:DUF4157 domain-containing protein n=1 Tax=Aliikangiella coralliicola TaxID=2592383 RepID=A0A545UD92_9GAMM|nr:DUF4157 domain-containing protein [Aliikangiella coralliicola]TQV87425.1 DUF4157 domain-containing protein [Aliikangiella coralliicola]
MAIKAIAEGNKSQTSRINTSKPKGTQPQLQAKASEKTSNLSSLITGALTDDVNAESPVTSDNRFDSNLATPDHTVESNANKNSISRKKTNHEDISSESPKKNNDNGNISSLSHLIRSSGVQAKLKIGAPNDKFEQEADRVADKVVSISSQSPAQSPSPAAPQNQGKGNSVQSLSQGQATQSKQNSSATAGKPSTQARTKIQTLPSSKPNLSKSPQQQGNQNAERNQEQNDEAEPTLQTKLMVQRGFMDLNDELGSQFSGGLLTRLIQSKSNRGDSDSSAENTASASFESSLSQSKGGGSPLPDNTRSEMESGIGADFSNVRVHTDSNAAQMSQNINAKAFTHGSDIYFNQGQYNPSSTGGKHLLAHELTHTVQQGASAQKSQQSNRSNQSNQSGDIQSKPDTHAEKAEPEVLPAQTSAEANNPQISTQSVQPKIQRGWLGDAWDAVSGAASAAVDWAADQLNAALDWAKEKFADFVQEIPGYKLVSVVLGQDPITGTPVARNGRNFIEAGLDIIPFGDKFQRKLEETGAMEEAATWLDGQIALVDISLSSITNSISRFWDSLSITDLGNVPAVLNRAANIVRAPVARVVTFATNIASKLLEIVKNAVLDALVTFVKDHTRGYPLLTVILGKDPITEEVVERNGMNLIRGFMLLSESGEEQLRQMEETGSLQRAADWIDGAVARLDLSWEAIQNMFSRAWDLVSIESLMNPIAAFQELANIFLEPAGRILRFLVEVAIKILQLIKDALISRLVAYARTVRGYPLLTVILGRDPFSGDPVLRNTENIIHGFMSLMEGGEAQFQEMKSSGAIGRLSARVEAAMGRLNFTWEYIRGLFTTAWESFSLADLAAPLEAFARLLGIFGDPLMRLIAFVWEIIKIVVEVLLIMMNFPFDLINNIITRAMEAIEDIKRDPIGFLKNLIRAVKQGFVQFFDNILTHLLNGVTDWLFGELGDAGITPPPDLSFGSILGLVLEILGITVDRIWAKLAERIGQERVDRVRSMIDRLTGIWTFVKDVMERGVVAIWEYIQERLSNLWNTVLDAIKNWIVTRIIQRVTAKLLSMLDPTGIMAVINGAIAFYNAVQSFIRYLRELLEIVNSFVVGVAEIARGDVSRAANFLEGALASGIPVAIGFLANQVGLSGLGRRIGEMIETVRGMVDTALDWLIDRAVAAGTALFEMGRNAVGAVRSAISNWWSARDEFTSEDGESHSVYITGSGSNARLMVASDPKTYREFLDTVTVPANKQADKTEAEGIADELDTAIQQAAVEGSSPAAAPGSSAAPAADHATNIQTLVTRLGDVTARFMPVSATTQSTPTIYGGHVHGFGSSASVMRLTSLHPTGSSPSSSLTNPPWSALRRRMDGGGTYYVRGHLLNDNLGGPGNTWDNLTPLTQTANNRSSASHLHGFETPVKDAIDAGKIANFVVHANYGRPSRSADATYFRAQGNPDDDVRADIVEAEEKIPNNLDCRAHEVDPTTGATGAEIKVFQVDNSIDTNRNNYSLSPTPKETVYLNDMSKSELMGLSGIGDALAQGIIDNRPFRTKAQLQSKVHIAEGRWAQMQRTPGKSVRIYRA